MRRLLILVSAVFLAGCATVPEHKVAGIWGQVAKEYGSASVEMPKVVWVNRDIYIDTGDREVFCNGAYNWKTNTVYLREWWADEDTVEHEFRHAQGDLLGEVKGRIVFR